MSAALHPRRGFRRCNSPSGQERHWIALGALWVIATIAFLIAFAILYHLLLPEKWHYLGAAQLRDLRSVALTAVTSAAAVRYFRRLAD